MSGGERALLLVGSAKRPASTSEVLGGHLLARLAEVGVATERMQVHRALKSEDGTARMLEAVDGCTLLVLAFPLYVDSLPALLVRALELIAGRRRSDAAPAAVQRLVAMVNSGFPEASQNATALRICRRFAREAGFEWAGGLALGGGEAIGGRPLAKVGGMARNVVRALDLAAVELAAGRPVPETAIRLMARPLVPTWLYLLFGGRGWRRRAARHGAEDRVGARPYAPGDDRDR